MVIQTLVLAAGLLTLAPASATDRPTGESPQGWIVELRGYTYHRDATPKTRWIIEFQWPQPKAAPKVEPVEARYYDDLRPVFEQLKKQKP
jgi:hypothetical protein